MYIKLKKGLLFWHYNVMAKNGKVVLTSETFASKSNAERAAEVAAKALKLEIK